MNIGKYMTKRVAWCWTLNNYTQEERFAINDSKCWRYVCYGLEVGKCETPHLQGYVEFTTRKSLKTIKNMGKPWNKMHFEPRMGTQEQAVQYCMKEGSFVELGKRSKQGKRADLDAYRQMAEEDGMRAVVRTGNMQQIRVAEKYMMYCEQERNWLTEVIAIYGSPGSGKSRLAVELAGGDYYRKNDAGKWFCGYDGHATLIIDDFRGEWWPLTRMLAILDRYSCRLECKGGGRQLRAKRIIVTSVEHPRMWYKYSHEPPEQLMRRITQLINLDEGQAEKSGVILDPDLKNKGEIE